MASLTSTGPASTALQNHGKLSWGRAFCRTMKPVACTQSPDPGATSWQALAWVVTCVLSQRCPREATPGPGAVGRPSHSVQRAWLEPSHARPDAWSVTALVMSPQSETLGRGSKGRPVLPPAAQACLTGSALGILGASPLCQCSFHTYLLSTCPLMFEV